MPGKHIDEAHDKAISKLIVPAPTEEQINAELKDVLLENPKLDDKAARVKAIKKYYEKNKIDKEVGTEVFESIQSSELTAEEKQELHCRIAKTCSQHEVDSLGTGNPNTLMREDSPGLNYMTAYLIEHSANYIKGVRDNMLEGAVELNERQNMSMEEKQVELARQILKAGEGNLDKLSPEARQFLVASMEPIKGNEAGTNMALTSLLNLRLTQPALSNIANDLRNNPKTQDLGNLMFGGTTVSLTYLNKVGIPMGEEKEGKKWDKLAGELRTEENLTHTKTVIKVLASGDDVKINKLASESKLDPGDDTLKLKADALGATADRLAEGRIARKSETLGPVMKAGDDQVKELEAKKKQLMENPSFGDKFKAFFKHGLKGVSGEIASIEKKIEITKVALEETARGVTVGDRQEYLRQMKSGFDMMKSEVVGESTARSMGESQMSVEEGETLYKTAAEMENKFKSEMKVLTVRQKMEAQAAKTQLGQENKEAETVKPKSHKM